MTDKNKKNITTDLLPFIDNVYNMNEKNYDSSYSKVFIKEAPKCVHVTCNTCNREFVFDEALLFTLPEEPLFTLSENVRG